jgi:hypothetical protein
MLNNEKISKSVSSKLRLNPKTPKSVKSAAGSELSQVSDHKKGGREK